MGPTGTLSLRRIYSGNAARNCTILPNTPSSAAAKQIVPLGG
jgi:hypothetical protein